MVLNVFGGSLGIPRESVNCGVIGEYSCVSIFDFRKIVNVKDEEKVV